MNAVSIRDATGSAVKASAAGRAIVPISWPSSSNLKIDLLKIKKKKGQVTHFGGQTKIITFTSQIYRKYILIYKTIIHLPAIILIIVFAILIKN